MRIAVGSVGLWLGVDLSTPRDCPCGKTEDTRGIHGLSCRLAFGMMTRHHEVNDLVWRALEMARVPSIKEPYGPSGVVRQWQQTPRRQHTTLNRHWYHDMPYHGMPANQWRETSSWLTRWPSPTCLSLPVRAVQHAVVRTSTKYSSLPSSNIFQPLAWRLCLGPINTTGISFLPELCRR